jgi:hypothetical protein
MKKTHKKCRVAMGCGLAFLTGVNALAGTFSNDFNSLQLDPNDPDKFVPPDGTSWIGNVTSGKAAGYDLSTGGVTGGALKLTLNQGSQQSTFIVNNLDNGEPFVGFDMTFNLRIGSGSGTPADGFSIFVGDFADGNYGEEGPGTIQGLTVVYDIYNNGGAVAEAPAIDIKVDGVIVAHRLGNPAIGALPTTLRSEAAFWPVKLHADPDGTVDLVVNNVVVYTNLPVFRAITDAQNTMRFGFAARTGGENANIWLDNLNITTVPTDAAAGQPRVVDIVPVRPLEQNASQVGGASVVFRDGTASIDPATVVFRYNNTVVTPTITRTKSDPGLENPDQTVITYSGVNGLLPAGAGTAQVTYATTSTPAVNNTFSWSFNVTAATVIPVAWKAVGVDETKPGFKTRLYQMDRWRSPGDQNITPVGERQLAFGFIDPTTHQPYPDVSGQDPALQDELGYFAIEDVLNFEQGGGNAGQINPSAPFPNLASSSTLDGGLGNFVMEFQGYLKLTAGGHRFGVQADDRVRFSFGPSFDAVGYAPQARTTGANAETIFDVVIPEDGFYPFRCSYWEGGGGAHFELFWINPANNQKVLVNDPNTPESPRAYREATGARPWVKRVLPVESWVGAFPNEKVIAEIIDGPTIGIDDASIKMQINGVDQTINKTRTGRSMLVERPSSDTNLLPSSGNTVRVIYSYSENGATVTKTNEWFFHVAPYYNAIPVANKVPASDINTAETGFNVRYTQMDASKDANQARGGRISGGGDANRMPNPEVHLNDGEIDIKTGLPYPNIALKSANNDFNDIFDFINFNNATVTPSGGTAQRTTPNSGFFSTPDGVLQTGNPAPLPPLPGGQDDGSAPGIPATQDIVGAGTSNNSYDNYVAELTTYLELKKGVHVFGFNSDDGFVASSAPNPKDTLGTLLGFFNGGRGNKTIITDTEYAPWLGAATTALTPPVGGGQESGSSLFSVVVPEDGIYPVRVVYWQGGGGINGEFYTVDQESGTYLLINDLTSTWGDGTVPANQVKAYRTYTGPARPWVKFSISPNPWEPRVQQAGPGPIKMIGPTEATKFANPTGTVPGSYTGATPTGTWNSSDIYNWAEGTLSAAPSAAGNSAAWADVVIGGIFGNAANNGVADPSLKLLIDDVEVPATKTVNGTDVTVAYKPNPILAPGSTHKATLVYAGVSNSWTFRVQDYKTVNASDKATQVGDPAKRGFSVKVAQAAAVRPGANGGNSAASAEAQLTGTPADVSTPGPENGRYIVPGIVNFSNFNNNNPSVATAINVGNFQRNVYGAAWPFPEFIDQPVPGLATGNLQHFTAEIFAWLEFPAAGYYRFGGNVDDGLVVKIGTPGVANGTALFTQDRGGGAADIPFSFVIPEAGLYPVRFVWYNGGGGGEAEFFTYDENGGKIPVNDPNNPKAIKAFYALQEGTVGATLAFTVTGNQITITWTGGGELQSAPSVTGPWSGSGDSDGSFTDTIPATEGMKFYRVAR